MTARVVAASCSSLNSGAHHAMNRSQLSSNLGSGHSRQAVLVGERAGERLAAGGDAATRRHVHTPAAAVFQDGPEPADSSPVATSRATALTRGEIERSR